MIQKQFTFTMPVIQSINDDGSRPGVSHGRQSIKDRFDRFHNQNPHVYGLIVELSSRMKKSGVKKFGMKGVFEYLRWQYTMQTQGDQFKLNNVFTALYARKIMDEFPELRGFFETRKRLTE